MSYSIAEHVSGFRTGTQAFNTPESQNIEYYHIKN